MLNMQLKKKTRFEDYLINSSRGFVMYEHHGAFTYFAYFTWNLDK